MVDDKFKRLNSLNFRLNSKVKVHIRSGLSKMLNSGNKLMFLLCFMKRICKILYIALVSFLSKMQAFA